MAQNLDLDNNLLIPSDGGYKIPALFATNNNAQNEKVYIILHGITTNKNEYLNFNRILAEILLRERIPSIRIDFIGHGESSRTQNDFTISSQVVDVIATCKWLLQNKGFSQIGLIGTSFGAPPCIFIASLLKQNISEIILVAPVLSYEDVFVNSRTKWGKELFNNLYERVLLNNEQVEIADEFYFNKRLVSEFSMIDLNTQIPKVDCKIKIIHGDADGIVNCQTSIEFAKRFPDIDLTIINDMEHGFTYRGDIEGNHPRTIKNLETIKSVILNEPL